ncbi:MAG: DNA polymerase III subunit chi [Magnetococcus sp. DMHC-6]
MARTQEGSVTARFYQLGLSTLEYTLPRLLAKIWEAGRKSCLVASSQQQALWLDELLWREPKEGFLPHGRCDRPNPELQPVLICLQAEDINGASVVLDLGDRVLENPARFDMVIDFVVGSDPQSVAASRLRYRAYRQLQCQMEYWVQGEGGKWEKR